MKCPLVCKDLELVLLGGFPIFVEVPEGTMRYVMMDDIGIFESEDGDEWRKIWKLPQPSEN